MTDTIIALRQIRAQCRIEHEDGPKLSFDPYDVLEDAANELAELRTKIAKHVQK